MRSRISHWVEAETLGLKTHGMSFEKIADHITGVAAGRQPALVAVPADLEFLPNYCISCQAVHKAFKRAIARIPTAEVEAYRKLGTERCEAMFLALQGGIQKGHPPSVAAAVKVLELLAKLNNLAAPAKPEATEQDAPLSIVQIKHYLRQDREQERLQQVAIEVESRAADDDKPAK
jgi:hypothetical protein